MAKIYTLGNEALTKLSRTGNIDDSALHDKLICTKLSGLSRDDKVVIYLDGNEDLGLRIAMHIRLSIQVLREGALCPVVLVSELPIQLFLHKGELSQIFISSKGLDFCSKDDLEVTLENIEALTLDDYKQCFLDNIQIFPDSMTGTHSIANQKGSRRVEGQVRGPSSGGSRTCPCATRRTSI